MLVLHFKQRKSAETCEKVHDVPTPTTKELLKVVGRRLREQVPSAGQPLPDLIEVRLAALRWAEREHPDESTEPAATPPATAPQSDEPDDTSSSAALFLFTADPEQD